MKTKRETASCRSLVRTLIAAARQTTNTYFPNSANGQSAVPLAVLLTNLIAAMQCFSNSFYQLVVVMAPMDGKNAEAELRAAFGNMRGSISVHTNALSQFLEVCDGSQSYLKRLFAALHRMIEFACLNQIDRALNRKSVEGLLLAFKHADQLRPAGQSLDGAPTCEQALRNLLIRMELLVIPFRAFVVNLRFAKTLQQDALQTALEGMHSQRADIGRTVRDFLVICMGRSNGPKALLKRLAELAE